MFNRKIFFFVLVFFFNDSDIPVKVDEIVLIILRCSKRLRVCLRQKFSWFIPCNQSVIATLIFILLTLRALAVLMLLLIRIFTAYSEFHYSQTRSWSFFILLTLLRAESCHVIYKIVSYLLKIFVQLFFQYIFLFLRIKIIEKLRICIRSYHFLWIIFRGREWVKRVSPQLSPRIFNFNIFFCI
jgi:hypothetical protein